MASLWRRTWRLSNGAGPPPIAAPLPLRRLLPAATAILMPAPAPQRPEPPASVPMASNEQRQTGGAGLDGWLLDNLFGSRR